MALPRTIMSCKWIGSFVIRKEITGSTNADAAELSNELPHGAVITAEAQTAGKGRRGRTWDSPAGENLYFSLLLKPDFEPDKASMLTLIMAVAVAEGIADVYESGMPDEINPSAVEIKWPNDIVVHGKKVCGILTEMQVEAGRIKHVIVGVGINVHRQKFDADGLQHASSLDREFAQRGFCKETKIDNRPVREVLLERILSGFEAAYEMFCKTGDLSFLQERYCDRLVNLHKEVQVLDAHGAFTGIALGIDDEGQLLIQKEDGSLVSVYAGEVSVRGLYGYV